MAELSKVQVVPLEAAQAQVERERERAERFDDEAERLGVVKEEYRLERDAALARAERYERALREIAELDCGWDGRCGPNFMCGSCRARSALATDHPEGGGGEKQTAEALAEARVGLDVVALAVVDGAGTVENIAGELVPQPVWDRLYGADLIELYDPGQAGEFYPRLTDAGRERLRALLDPQPNGEPGELRRAHNPNSPIPAPPVREGRQSG